MESIAHHHHRQAKGIDIDIDIEIASDSPKHRLRIRRLIITIIVNEVDRFAFATCAHRTTRIRLDEFDRLEIHKSYALQHPSSTGSPPSLVSRPASTGATKLVIVPQPLQPQRNRDQGSDFERSRPLRLRATASDCGNQRELQRPQTLQPPTMITDSSRSVISSCFRRCKVNY